MRHGPLLLVALLLAPAGPPTRPAAAQRRCHGSSPLVIALGDRTEHLFTSAEDGVVFDIDGDAISEQLGWIRRGSGAAFLALDRDGDGHITSGTELFTRTSVPGASSAVDALQRMAMATNRSVLRGSVSSDDPLFARLLLWTDANQNGIGEPWELRPAVERLSDIGLGYIVVNRPDQYGNVIRFQGWAHVRTAPGRNRSRSAAEDDARRIPTWEVCLAWGP